MRSCIKRSSNSSIARRAYSDLLTPKRLAVASMLTARFLGMRREKEMRSSIGAPMRYVVMQIVLHKMLQSSDTHRTTDCASRSPHPAKGVRVKSPSRVRIPLTARKNPNQTKTKQPKPTPTTKPETNHKKTKTKPHKHHTNEQAKKDVSDA